MRVFITASLLIDLGSEKWHCRKCDGEIGPARESYKHGLLVYEREPSEIHKPIIDPSKYEFTFAPDPAWCRILEYYCPHCGLMHEVEYLPPGHPPAHDIDFDIDALKAQWAQRPELKQPVLGPDFDRPRHHHGHGHGH